MRGDNLDDLSSVLDALPAAVACLDARGRVTAANRCFQDLLSLDAGRLLGRDFFDLLHPDDAMHAATLRTLPESSDAPSPPLELRLRGGDGDLWTCLRFAALPPLNDGARLVVAAEELSARIVAQAALRESEAHLRRAQAIGNIGSWHLDIGSNLLHWSEEIFRIFGVTSGQPLSLEDFLARVHPEDRDLVAESWAQALVGAPYDLQHRILVDDQVRWVRERAELLFDQDGQAIEAFGVVQDISEIRRTEDLARIMGRVFEHSQTEAFLITDALARIERVNEAFTALTGYREDEVLGRNPSILASGRHPPEFYREMWTTLAAKGSWQGEVWDRRKDGTHYIKRLSIQSIVGDSGKTTHYIGSFSDITESRRSQERIHYLAHHDSLTGLPNRVSLEETLTAQIDAARLHERPLALLFLDLDNFKLVNDSLGHAVGDALLIKVAARIREAVGENDLVFRFGGDEFIVLLTGTVTPDECARAAARILGALSRTFHVDGYPLYIAASIGIALLPEDGLDVGSLLRHADAAMYQAKAERGARFQFFHDGIKRSVEDRLALEQNLRMAIECGQFLLTYQPKFALADGALTGMEALLRWQHPEQGLISPGHFIPIAEESGLIVPIGGWVIGEACRQISAWRSAGLSPPRIAINLSVHQLRSPGLIELIAGHLAVNGLDWSALEFEVTESAAMSQREETAEQLARMRDLGARIALDDFGTGHSSLAYLKHLPLDVLKVDRSFVASMATDTADAAIVSAVIALARALGLTVVAEGLETEEQRQRLRVLGCQQAQGFLLSRPLLPEAAMNVLRANRPATPKPAIVPAEETA